MGSKAELSSKPDEIAGRVTIGAFAARVLVSVLAAIQLGLGVVGLMGIYLYIAEAKVNPERDKWEAAGPITIGNNVWLRGGVIICPGVTIGDNTVVGAGAVVIRDLRAGIVAVGNPARIIREL